MLCHNESRVCFCLPALSGVKHLLMKKLYNIDPTCSPFTHTVKGTVGSISCNIINWKWIQAKQSLSHNIYFFNLWYSLLQGVAVANLNDFEKDNTNFMEDRFIDLDE